MAAQVVLTRGSFWIRLVAGLGLVWALFQGFATGLASGRGERGLAVGAAVVMALLAVEWLFFALRPVPAAAALGLGRPGRSRGPVLALAIAGLLLLYFPHFSAATESTLRPVPGWPWLALGLFAQGGLAEEALFRGYLFRRVRERQPFWRAAWLSMVPFTAVHLLLFATLPAPIAAASVLLAVATAFPLARLFELGGGNVWAPALVHGAIQTIKLCEPPEAHAAVFPLGWMLLAGLLPFLAFLAPRGRRPRPGRLPRPA
jgi:membrane protease YdiL (CAAX protease family)